MDNMQHIKSYVIDVARYSRPLQKAVKINDKCQIEANATELLSSDLLTQRRFKLKSD